MANPILFAVDDDASVLAQLRRELGGRYGADYQVLTEPSARIALERIEELDTRGEHVALVIADQWMPEMTGLELLTRVHDYHLEAKRALLVDFGDQSTAEPILRKPRRRPDQTFSIRSCAAVSWVRPLSDING